MNLVSLEKVSLRLAEQQVLDEVTVGIDDGDRVGVIGLNGSGKSTLLRVIFRQVEPDSGRVVHASGLRMAHLAQSPALDEVLPPLEATLGSGPAEGERAARARGLLAHLDLGDVEASLGALSGGQRKRVALVRALLDDPDLLILDEPTNHLDVDVIEWLEGRLLTRSGALLLVTHDRYLLDRVATRVVEVTDGRLHSHQGGYASYLEARALREEQAAAAEQRRRNRARTELAWLRRSPAARTGKARYRVERAEALIAVVPDAPKEALDVALPSRRLGAKVVELHNAGASFDDRTVLRGVDLKLARDSRIGVLGPNGSGKTTLLRLLAGRLEPATGKVVVGETVAVGWYGQEPQDLPPRQRVIDAVKEVSAEAATGLLERFGFEAAVQQAWVGELSGGERRRLELLRVLAAAPNLLLLDEPTNDLDLDTLAVLEEALDTFEGAVVVATHDRYFLDRVCRDVLAIERDATVRHHPGGWAEWRARRGAVASPTATTEQAPQPERRSSRTPKLAYHERRELTQLERRILELEDRRARLEKTLAATGTDYEAAQAQGEELTAVLAELETAETRWLELSLVEGERAHG